MLLFILGFTQCHNYSVQVSFAISPLSVIQKVVARSEGGDRRNVCDLCFGKVVVVVVAVCVCNG